MTHTMHRAGPEESFREDYIVFCMAAQGYNNIGAAPKLRRFLRLAWEFGPVNLGDMKTGSIMRHDFERIVEQVQDTSIVHAVLTNREKVIAFLAQLKDTGLGLSVNITGIMEQTRECCRAAGLQRHSIEHSLGIRGRIDRLPEEYILRIATMCGHGMVSFNLVRKCILDIKRGKKTLEEAARALASPCECGVFNPVRAGELLREMLPLWTLEIA